MLAFILTWQNLGMLGVGAVAGVLGGLLGIGGGIVMIPAMLLIFGQHYGENSFHLYKLAAITTSIILSVPAALRHYRARAIIPTILPGVLPLALAGTVVGVVASGYMVGDQVHILRRIFGGFLEFVILANLYQARRAAFGEASLRDRCPVATRRGLFGSIIGLPAGILAGLLGIGGGAWAVPAQRLMLGVCLRNAIANSSAMILVVAPATAIALSVDINLRIPSLDVWQGWWLACWLAPGAVLGGWIGAGLTHKAPLKWVRMIFHTLLAITGLRLMFS